MDHIPLQGRLKCIEQGFSPKKKQFKKTIPLRNFPDSVDFRILGTPENLIFFSRQNFFEYFLVTCRDQFLDKNPNPTNNLLT